MNLFVSAAVLSRSQINVCMRIVRQYINIHIDHPRGVLCLHKYLDFEITGLIDVENAGFFTSNEVVCECMH